MTATTHSSRNPASSQRDDERTVGDLLLDADIAARELLWDAPPDTAKAKARSWGEVVEAAAELWSSCPDRTDEAAWVDAGDAYANRPVTLPDALRQSLVERSASVVAAGLRVDSAGTFLAAGRQTSLAGPVIDGRAHEERAIGVPPAPGPGYGCDR